MAKSNGIGTNSFNEDLNLLEKFDTSESINIHLEKSSPIVPSLSNPINTPGSVQILNGTMRNMISLL